MIKLCVFDFDSTLMDGESIDILASKYGVFDEVSKITTRAMNGELDFFESLSKRVSLLKGMPYELVLQTCKSFPLMKGAKEIISYLKSKNIIVAVFSGGFHEGVDEAQKVLNFDIAFANYLHQKDGFLSGLVGGEMMFSNSKGVMLKRLKELLRLKDEEVACVGDGANDISMFEQSSLKIAFCAKEILRQNASFCVDEKDLSKIKDIIK
ncbi:phosphoserine phosphatase SerB [Campylobacter avium]|uniref:phosphoserine phosphatase SerB n=1 Tax=Campylobacter avium TaxID=522485 RepID=UPI00255C223F|nr:phosphoserine phosphatase SerB [Campylobacter avium]